MEYDCAEHLDLEWQSLLQKHLQTFSCQKDSSKLYLFDEVLEKVFCPGADFEPEINYKDKEICEKCLIESLNFLSRRPMPPRQTQVHFLLNVAKYTSKDETCFINLTANNVISNLVYISQPVNVSTEKATKILFLELLHSLLEHQSGVKALIETKYWPCAYQLIIDNQNVDRDISNMGYKFVKRLLEKTLSLDSNVCYEIIQAIAGPILNASRLIDSKTQSMKKSVQLIKELKPSIVCLVEILERLLEDYSAGVFNCIMRLKVDVASDTVSKTTNDKSIRLILNRVTIVLSFYKLTDVFDGIKSISQDPLAVTGLLRIFEAELDKGAIDLFLELCYYALKYIKCIAERLPKCDINGKIIDIEKEVISLQLEPVMLITEKLNYNTLLKSLDEDLVRMSHLSKIIQNMSVNTLMVARKVKDLLPQNPFEIYTIAVTYIIQSRNLYSKEQLSNSFEGLIYSLQDTVDHLKLDKNTTEIEEFTLHGFVSELLKAILIFIESFNLSWPDSVKILELAQIVIGGCSAYQWPAPIVVQGFKLLQEIISRRLSPAMSLLIDCDEDLNELGPLLYQKCFTSEWEVRKAVLDVVYTIAVSANNSFPSFKNLLLDDSRPHIVSTMALNDENAAVRVAAFNCLYEMVRIENMEEILPKNPLIMKILDVLDSNAPPTVKEKAIELITRAYMDRDGLEEKTLANVYKYMERVILSNPDACVQLVALKFWCTVVIKHLSNQGWIDYKFPAVIFSKRIVCMTNKEVRKRLYKVLNQLSLIGCLDVYEKLSHFGKLSSPTEAYFNIVMGRFNGLFREHEVTPESMLFHEEISDLQSISGDIFLSPPSSVNSVASDEMIQGIIDDTVMKMLPDDIQFIQDEDLYSLMESKCYRSKQQAPIQHVPQQNRQMTPSEFVDFVYKRIRLISNGEDNITDEANTECPIRTNDVYNIIDY